MQVREENYRQALIDYNKEKTVETFARVLRTYCLWYGESHYEILDYRKYTKPYFSYLKECYKDVFSGNNKYLLEVDFNKIDIFELETAVWDYAFINNQLFDEWEVEERIFAEAMFKYELNDDVISDIIDSEDFEL